MDFQIPLLSLRRRRRPSLIVVENYEEIPALSSGEKRLYDTLSGYNYYVTPKKMLGKHLLNFALVPFRIAIVKEDAITKSMKKKLNRLKWSIVVYTEEELQKDFYEVVRRIKHITDNFHTES